MFERRTLRQSCCTHLEDENLFQIYKVVMVLGCSLTNWQTTKVIYQATACSRRPPRDRTLALALLYVSLSLKP